MSDGARSTRKPRKAEEPPAWLTAEVATVLRGILEALDTSEDVFWINSSPEHDAFNRGFCEGLEKAEEKVVGVLREHGVPIKRKPAR